MNSYLKFQFEHHRLATEKLVSMYQDHPEVIGIILGGSVAKGLARTDSDIDGMIVVTDSYYEELRQKNETVVCLFDAYPVDQGYYDLKFFTLDYFQKAASSAYDPTRNSFIKARVLYDRSTRIESLLKAITTYPEHEVTDRLMSFFSAFSLYSGYFWHDSLRSDEIYLKTFTAADIVLFGLRLILVHNKIFFPSHKRLIETVANLGQREKQITLLANRFLKSLNDDDKIAFEMSIRQYTDWPIAEDSKAINRQFVEDHEQWWYRPRPNLFEW